METGAWLASLLETLFVSSPIGLSNQNAEVPEDAKLNPTKEEENEEDYDNTPAPDQSPEPTVMYCKHFVSPTRDHQMTTMTTEPRQDEPYTNPNTLEPISTTPELHYYETSDCTQQENPFQSKRPLDQNGPNQNGLHHNGIFPKWPQC